MVKKWTGRTAREMVSHSHRSERFTKALAVSAIVLALLAGFVRLVRWEMGRECIRWSTRLESEYVGGSMAVCVEFQPRRSQLRSGVSGQ